VSQQQLLLQQQLLQQQLRQQQGLMATSIIGVS
jgi:hypothetical protein